MSIEQYQIDDFLKMHKQIRLNIINFSKMFSGDSVLGIPKHPSIPDFWYNKISVDFISFMENSFQVTLKSLTGDSYDRVTVEIKPEWLIVGGEVLYQKWLKANTDSFDNFE